MFTQLNLIMISQKGEIMSHYNLAFLGFGNVGKALAELLLSKRTDIQEKTGVTFNVTGIATGSLKNDAVFS